MTAPHGTTLTFPDGSSIRGDTAQEVFDTWRADSWNDSSEDEFRQEVAKRAYVWSGAIVDDQAPVEQVLEELAAAGMFRLEND